MNFPSERERGREANAGVYPDELGRERPRGDRPPSLGETLTRVLLLGSTNTSDAARRHADLVIKPRAAGVGLLEFTQLDAAREAGRVAAREALENAPASIFA
jgi:predicted acylesterase/phospholipase RssA